VSRLHVPPLLPPRYIWNWLHSPSADEYRHEPTCALLYQLRHQCELALKLRSNQQIQLVVPLTHATVWEQEQADRKALDATAHVSDTRAVSLATLLLMRIDHLDWYRGWRGRPLLDVPAWRSESAEHGWTSSQYHIVRLHIIVECMRTFRRLGWPASNQQLWAMLFRGKMSGKEVENQTKSDDPDLMIDTSSEADSPVVDAQIETNLEPMRSQNHPAATHLESIRSALLPAWTHTPSDLHAPFDTPPPDSTGPPPPLTQSSPSTRRAATLSQTADLPREFIDAHGSARLLLQRLAIERIHVLAEMSATLDEPSRGRKSDEWSDAEREMQKQQMRLKRMEHYQEILTIVNQYLLKTKEDERIQQRIDERKDPMAAYDPDQGPNLRERRGLDDLMSLETYQEISRSACRALTLLAPFNRFTVQQAEEHGDEPSDMSYPATCAVSSDVRESQLMILRFFLFDFLPAFRTWTQTKIDDLRWTIEDLWDDRRYWMPGHRMELQFSIWDHERTLGEIVTDAMHAFNLTYRAMMHLAKSPDTPATTRKLIKELFNQRNALFEQLADSRKPIDKRRTSRANQEDEHSSPSQPSDDLLLPPMSVRTYHVLMQSIFAQMTPLHPSLQLSIDPSRTRLGAGASPDLYRHAAFMLTRLPQVFKIHRAMEDAEAAAEENFPPGTNPSPLILPLQPNLVTHHLLMLTAHVWRNLVNLVLDGFCHGKIPPLIPNTPIHTTTNAQGQRPTVKVVVKAGKENLSAFTRSSVDTSLLPFTPLARSGVREYVKQQLAGIDQLRLMEYAAFETWSFAGWSSIPYEDRTRRFMEQMSAVLGRGQWGEDMSKFSKLVLTSKLSAYTAVSTEQAHAAMWTAFFRAIRVGQDALSHHEEMKARHKTDAASESRHYKVPRFLGFTGVGIEIDKDRLRNLFLLQPHHLQCVLGGSRRHGRQIHHIDAFADVDMKQRLDAMTLLSHMPYEGVDPMQTSGVFVSHSSHPACLVSSYARDGMGVTTRAAGIFRPYAPARYHHDISNSPTQPTPQGEDEKEVDEQQHLSLTYKPPDLWASDIGSGRR